MGKIKDAVSRLEKKYEIGLKVFEQLFKLTDKELKEKLETICGDKLKRISNNDDLLTKSSCVQRIIEDERPSKITIAFYDRIIINAFGINYDAEHHDKQDSLAKFNEHFSL